MSDDEGFGMDAPKRQGAKILYDIDPHIKAALAHSSPYVWYHCIGGYSFGSRLIEWGTHSQLSHMDILLPDGWLVGARSDNPKDQSGRRFGKGVQVRSPHYYGRVESTLTIQIPVTAKQKRVFYTLLAEQVGKPYDHTAIWGFVLNRDWREIDSWICSEMGIWLAEQSGITGEFYLSANRVAPSTGSAILTSQKRVKWWEDEGPVLIAR